MTKIDVVFDGLNLRYIFNINYNLLMQCDSCFPKQMR